MISAMDEAEERTGYRAFLAEVPRAVVYPFTSFRPRWC